MMNIHFCLVSIGFPSFAGCVVLVVQWYLEISMLWWVCSTICTVLPSEFSCFGGCCTICTVLPSEFPCFGGCLVLVVLWCLRNFHALQGMQY